MQIGLHGRSRLLYARKSFFVKNKQLITKYEHVCHVILYVDKLLVTIQWIDFNDHLTE